MSTAGHPERAAAFAADADRSAWHDESLWLLREKRDRAARAVPDWEALREAAARIKTHTLSRLPDYLEEFEARASALGVHVHWAEDAAEHNETVLRILNAQGARRVVKSKSMLTEECHLNPFLEARGIEVVDTDLGERIVQLRAEPPSHIVMPAIHLRREEVGVLFHERLGAEPGLSDPTALTEIARGHLRAKFLAADAGITGVNFAIAETGGIVVCTNEGNADLGVGLPRLHIACMGIEKVIPRARDLAVFLRLLARSATGQAITSYSSHFHGPAPGGELHVVLVDAGRSDLLRRAALRPALGCIRCGACLNTCPVYRRSGGHSYGTTVPGPIGSVLAPARDARTHASLPHACSLCGSCAAICPVKIDLPRELLALRADVAASGGLGHGKRIGARVAGWVLRSPRRVAVLARFARAILPRIPGRWLEDNAWTRQRALPEFAPQSFRELHARGLAAPRTHADAEVGQRAGRRET